MSGISLGMTRNARVRPARVADKVRQRSTLVSEAVSKLIQESAPLVLASLIGGSIQNIVQQMQYGVQNVRGY